MQYRETKEEGVIQRQADRNWGVRERSINLSYIGPFTCILVLLDAYGMQIMFVCGELPKVFLYQTSNLRNEPTIIMLSGRVLT